MRYLLSMRHGIYIRWFEHNTRHLFKAFFSWNAIAYKNVAIEQKYARIYNDKAFRAEPTIKCEFFYDGFWKM